MVNNSCEESINTQFFNLLANKRIQTVFQAIVSLRDASIYGYEALSRGPKGSALEYPSNLFNFAAKHDMLWELELLCRINAIETVSQFSTKINLFLNVNPHVMHDDKFKQGFTKEFLTYYNITPEQIIFEISEKDSVKNISDFINTIDNYKKQNYKIAIDDAGAGYSGLNLISDIHPHFIKLDMNLIRDVDKDMFKQTLVKSFAEFAALTNTHLIAEGIETKSELLKLIEIGVSYGQGFYLQAPQEDLAPLHEQVQNEIVEANIRKNRLYDKRASDLFISSISNTQTPLSPTKSVLEVYELMERDPTLSGICVTEDENLVGLVTRSDLYKRLSGRYGFTLYSKKTIYKIMRTEFLRVDYHESIETVAKKAMNRELEDLYSIISVTKDGKYYGVVTVKDLLEKAMQVQVNYAKYINPLSELPGNILIERKLEECIGSERECTILYFDIDNFKAYNDIYGFENGDRIIISLVQILKKTISEERDFIGHIGGDDFIAVIYGNHIAALCKRIIRLFEKSVIRFYNKNDIEKGYITAKNRHGVEEDFPLLTITIVGTTNIGNDTTFKLTRKIATLKKICKLKPGSNYLIE